MHAAIAVLVNSTVDLKTIDTPTVLMFYVISPIELRFVNGSTLLLNNFAQGNCTVEPQITLDKVHGISGGLHPLREGDDKSPPTGETWKLAELDGKSVSRKIRVNIGRGNYVVEKIEEKLDNPIDRATMPSIYGLVPRM